MRRRQSFSAVAVVALGLLGAALGSCAGDDDTNDTTRETTSDMTPADVPESSAAPTGVPETEAVFRASVAPVTADDLAGAWTDGIGCTPPEELAVVTVTHHGFDDAVHEGRIVVAAEVADEVTAVFSKLFDQGFPIEAMEPVSAFDGDDDASMAANNSSGYNCRNVAGTNSLSDHAFGRAIDINPLMNPWVHDGIVDPPEGEAYADRSRRDPGLIHADDDVVRAFAAQGWQWGGDWNEPDYQHFYRP